MASKFHFKYGAMNSGKSDTLIKTAYNYTEQGLHVATIKPAIDTKGDRMIVARGGASREVDILAAPDDNVRHQVAAYIGKKALDLLNVVLVDESQFLTRSQVDQLYDVAKVDDISVIAFGLRTDFRTESFPGSMRLMELADNIEKIPTMCVCGSQAEFNCRQINGEFVFEGEQVAIDGEDEITYTSLCGLCLAKAKAATSQ